MNYIAEYDALGYDLEINEERAVALCKRRSPRARLGYKIEFNYRYGSVERLYEHVAKFIADVKANIERKAKAKADAKAAKEALLADVKVGDLFAGSFSYESTYPFGYEVVEVKGKSLVVREVRLDVIEGTEYGMSCMRRAVKGAYVGEPMTKRLTAYGSIKIGSGSYAYKKAWDSELYNSWYG